MPDLTSLLERAERAASRVPLPPDGLEQLRLRRIRKHRNQRIAAGIVGIALFVAAIVAVGVAARDGGQPASSGTTGPSGAPPLAGPDFARVLETDPPDYVLDLDTGAATPLPEAIVASMGDASMGDWRLREGRYAASPDGSTLAYVAPDVSGRFQIFVADLDGSGIRQATHDLGAAIWPAWSPDGTKLAYHGTSFGVIQGGHALFVLDVATGEATKVINVLPAWDATPTFTPDGSSLLYTDGGEVRTIPVDGGRSTLLFGHGRGGMEYAFGGSMSPDGSLVTMMGNEPGGPGTGRFVANADGTELRPIRGAGSVPAGTWSPDGTRIVCTGYGRNHILVVDIATGESTSVAEGSGAIWLDDHTLLVEGLTDGR